jgi:hypothetical protein
MRKQALTPKTARTFAEICKLKRDNVDMPEGWAMLDEGGVIITNQKSGEPVTGRVHVSHRSLQKIIRWYETGVV